MTGLLLVADAWAQAATGVPSTGMPGVDGTVGGVVGAALSYALLALVKQKAGATDSTIEALREEVRALTLDVDRIKLRQEAQDAVATDLRTTAAALNGAAEEIRAHARARD